MRLFKLCFMYGFLFFFEAICLVVDASNNSGRIQNDQASLVSFMTAIFSDPHGSLESWNSSGIDVCHWSGIACNDARNAVVELRLSGKSLRGTLSPALGGLSMLTVLDLSMNFFEGHIPAEIGSLVELQHLSLSSNFLEGEIPSELSLLHQLVYLDLGNNWLLGGDFPREIFCNGSSLLEYIDMSKNNLTGAIPLMNGCGLRSLTYLSLRSNRLVGRVPSALSNFTMLRTLDLGSNMLSGELPSDIVLRMPQLQGLHLADNDFISHDDNTNLAPFFAALTNASDLRVLELAANNLGGELPPNIGDLPGNLTTFILDENLIHGPIPPPIVNLFNLIRLNLSSNCLSGEIPSDLSHLSILVHLDLSRNNLSGSLPDSFVPPQLQELLLSENQLSGTIPPSLGKCIILETLDLSRNKLSGPIPDSFSFLRLKKLLLFENQLSGTIPPSLGECLNLQILDLSRNKLSGSLPDGFALSQLQELLLFENQLSGTIPTSIGKCIHLVILDLSKNKLAGSLPDSFAKLSQLRRLSLFENRLYGTIPPSLGKCINLVILDLSHNRISGMIPEPAMRSLNIYLNLSSNFFHGDLPSVVSKMDKALAIDLSWNNLSGNIPAQLGSFTALESLNLSGNGLEGPLPQSVGQLPYLRALDVSFNRLTGPIPKSFQNSRTLKQLNFSFNNFSGSIADIGAFSGLTIDSFLGNSGLCGSIKGMRACKKRQHYVLVILPVLLSLVTMTILCVFGYPPVLRRKFRRQRSVFSVDINGKEMQESREHKYPKVSYRQLLEATGGFNPSALIGSGRFGHVYRGTLRDNTRVAVKVLVSKTAGEISGSFRRECRILKRTRHRNLIRIITICSRPDFKALVLPLMSNGSLERHLYPSCGLDRGLDLVQLVSICSDVAEGVAYLHHHSPVRVVHRDLKPSNILLDDNMTALVADFGIARLVHAHDEGASFNDSASTSSTDDLLCGSVGYIAPEYGMGRKASTQGDVYSFGVILLEIVTGLRPTDVRLDEGSNLHEWVKRHYPDNLEPIVQQALTCCSAPQVMPECTRRTWCEVIVELIKLGLLCTKCSPSMRPNMKDVAHEMNRLVRKMKSVSHSPNIDRKRTNAAAINVK